MFLQPLSMTTTSGAAEVASLLTFRSTFAGLGVGGVAYGAVPTVAE